MDKKQFESMKQSDRIEYMLRKQDYEIPFFDMTVLVAKVTLFFALLGLLVTYVAYPDATRIALQSIDWKLMREPIINPIINLTRILWKLIPWVFMIEFGFIIYQIIKKMEFNKKWIKKASSTSQK